MKKIIYIIYISHILAKISELAHFCLRAVNVALSGPTVSLLELERWGGSGGAGGLVVQNTSTGLHPVGL